MTAGVFFQRHTVKAVAGDSRAVDFAVRTKRYAVETSSFYRCTIDSFGGHSAFFIDCKTRTAERCISLADHGIAAHGQPRAGIRAADGYTVDTCDACQSAVHIDVGNICQAAEQVVCKFAVICIVGIASLMTKGYLIVLCRPAICTNSNSVVSN